VERTVGKIRVYEIAHSVGMTPTEVVEKLRARGELVTTASSTVHAAVADAFVAKVRADSAPRPLQTVAVRRRAVASDAALAPPAEVSSAVPAAPEIPLEMLDIRARYERLLAEARARTEAKRRATS